MLLTLLLGMQVSFMQALDSCPTFSQDYQDDFDNILFETTLWVLWIQENLLGTLTSFPFVLQ